MGFGDKSKKEKQGEKNALTDAKAKEAAEGASWEDSDKKAGAKAGRAESKAEKEEEAARKRAEKKALEEADEANFETKKSAADKKKKPEGKLSQAQIAANIAAANAAMASQSKKKPVKTSTVDAAPLMPNPNRSNEVTVKSIEGALKELELDMGDQKMTYKQFEQDMLDKVRADNPGLKLSAAKQKVFKLWERSPLNPKNIPRVNPASEE